MYAQLINNPTLTGSIQAAADALAINAEWLRDAPPFSGSTVPQEYRERANAVKTNADKVIGLSQGVGGYQLGAGIELVGNTDLCDELAIIAQGIANHAGYLKNAPIQGPIITEPVAEQRNALTRKIEALQGLMEGYKL
jgi:hypothetical protein